VTRNRFALLTAGLSIGLATVARAQDRTFTFTQLDRTYTDLVGEVQPIEQGPLTVRPSSPKNSVTLKENRLKLHPEGNGVYSGHLELDIFGKGWMVADVDAGSLSTRFQDELLLPPQTLRFDGKVKVERVEGGYRATALEAPRTFEIALQSKLVQSLLSWCDTASSVPFTRIDCTGMERSLTHVQIPLPGAGGPYFLADTDLTPDERRDLDGYLFPPPPPAQP
jgi:hypothetical protein